MGSVVEFTRRAAIALLTGLMPVAADATVADPERRSDVAVKAAFLFRFAGFVEWPDDRAAGAPFEFAVVGNPDLASELRRRLPGRTIAGRPPIVREHVTVEGATQADVLYVGPGHARRVPRVVGRLARTLVVTDEPRGLDAGAAINFLRDDERVRFEVSLGAAERAGLRLRAGLLSLAARVEGHDEKPRP